MFILMVIIFVLGYIAIALEHPIKIDKAASALLIGSLTWVAYIMGGLDILNLGHSPAWAKYLASHPDAAHGAHGYLEFIVDHEIIHHLGEISEILFFLLGAMTIVEIVDTHQGFKIITDRITTTNKVKLLWVLSILTFFMSAVLDNLTTTIVMVALLRKLVADQKSRWFFASMVVLAANAGGAWSPIGDVTTIMLWIGKQVTTWNIIVMVLFPSIINILVPLVVLSFVLKGNVDRPVVKAECDTRKQDTPDREKTLVLIMGVSALLFVPVFKTVTHLPPYMGMLFGLGVLWVITELMHRKKHTEVKSKLTVVAILRKVDVPTVLFFLGILSAVASLQSAGHLAILARFLDEHLGNIYTINIAIGILSAIVDNVPLVAGAMGMYTVYTPEMIAAITDPTAAAYAEYFMQDGLFWEFLAYCAGTGGSILIIGSAAGVAAMGLEKIDFIWYLKHISWIALLGYLAGAGAYYLQSILLMHGAHHL
ncbi:MAG TPA: sodium:proton antiporter NhaD [Bacteroidales bacterium]|nr:sodium:proton antiporter NhaD [Bacteroidales bacterium]